MTGGYSGVGYELSKILYEHGGSVYIAGRSNTKGENAIAEIREAAPKSYGRLEVLSIDLSDMSSVKAAAATFLAKESRLDVLVNNAGVSGHGMSSSLLHLTVKLTKAHHVDHAQG